MTTVEDSTNASQPVGEGDHVAGPNDCALKTAARAGVPVESIWTDIRNMALTRARIAPNVLLQGDRMFVPPPRQKFADAETDQRHTFERKTSVRLRLKLTDAGGPLKHARCALLYKSSAEGESISTVKSVDADGMVQFTIPATLDSALLRVDLGGREVRHDLHIGALDPADSPSGAHQRLLNLGYTIGATIGSLAARIKPAMQRFQVRQQLPVTEKLDPTTASVLVKVHGS